MNMKMSHCTECVKVKVNTKRIQFFFMTHT
ncbi:hypothetical protein E2C01_033996 [Portunus trituberculatus]|uniref:Uncharacterized protein n=1 Tax=Portunus trituberculatus TaxID=210409 RepID=A0A5B7F5L7_PORTR|nr:hypothetical protein [Portunus trituberculatus]